MNNADLYNAVLSGIAGSNQNVRVGVTLGADYTRFADRAVILASAVDALIPTTTVTQADALLMTQVAAGLDFNRCLVGTTPLYSGIASDIAALWTEFRGRISSSPSGGLIVSVDNIADLRLLPFIASTVLVRRYAGVGTENGGGTMNYLPSDHVSADNQVTIFVSSVTGARYQRAMTDGSIQLSWAGAQSGGVGLAAINTSAAASALAVLKASGGGTLVIPEGDYHGLNVGDRAFFSIDFNGCKIVGLGPKSRIIVDSDSDVAVHVSPEPILSVAPVGYISDFEMAGVTVVGTGVYHYYAMTYGRLVLLRGTKNASVHHCIIYDASMIGIGSEGDAPYCDVSNNRLINCKFTAINYNARSYGSIISNNRISGTDGNVDSWAIQATGHCSIIGNTIYGSVVNFATASGILWGEGNYDGSGIISGNVIMHCACGIKSQYHGPTTISNNLLINCKALAGIAVINVTAPPWFTVASTHTSVSANICINCYPNQLLLSGNGVVAVGNQCYYLSNPVNPSAPTEPDAIEIVKPESGISILDGTVSLIGNIIDGGNYGVEFMLNKPLGAISGNTVINTTFSAYSFVHPVTYTHVNCPDTSVERIANRTLRKLSSATLPTEGMYEKGSKWTPLDYSLGVPNEAIVSESRVDTVNGALAAGDVVWTLTGLADFTTGETTIIGVILSDGTYHWTFAVTGTGHLLTVGNGVPIGKSVDNGATVYITVWHYEPQLETSRLGGSSSSVTLSADASSPILIVSLTGLLPSRYYTATLGGKVTLWRTATPMDSGSVDSTQDIAIQTDPAGIPAITFLGVPLVDTTRLPATLISATMAMSNSVGGFTISATRTPTIECAAKAKWWISGLEDLGVAP